MDQVAWIYRTAQFIAAAFFWLLGLSLLFMLAVAWVALIYMAWVTGVEIVERISFAIWGLS